MTGRLIYQTPAGRKEYGGGHSLRHPAPDQPHKHTRIIFTFADDSHLYFNDMRKFGYMSRVELSEITDRKEKLGREPIGENYDFAWFQDLFTNRRTSIKAALLAQSPISGLGNIYVDEALWRAKVRPNREAKSLTNDELRCLHKTTEEVLRDSLALGGTTIKDFADTGGSEGNFTDELKVFGRDGESCPRCGAEIKKDKIAGRGTHFCPNCQK